MKSGSNVVAAKVTETRADDDVGKQLPFPGLGFVRSSRADDCC